MPVLEYIENEGTICYLYSFIHVYCPSLDFLCWFFGLHKTAPTLDIPSIHIFLSSEMSVLENIENEENKSRPVKKISLSERSEFEIFRASA